MMSKLTKIKFIAFVVFLMRSQSTFAHTDKSDKGGDLFFILDKSPKPAIVTSLPPEKPADSFMRLPDRASAGTSDLPRASARMHSGGAVDLGDAQQVVPDDKDVLKPALVTFKPTTIRGTVKLPRVRFSDFRPAVELREEMPAIDFTSKTLKDGGL